MLVNINLLPQREKKSLSPYILLAIGLLILIIGGCWLYFQGQSLKLELSTAEEQLTMIKKLREVEEQKASLSVSTSSANQLQGIVSWVEEQPVSTVIVLHKLTAALPKYGAFQNYQYAGDSSVTLSVQFDTLFEVSAYLHELEEDPIINEVKLKNVKTVSVNTPGSEERALTGDDQEQFMPRYMALFQMKLDKESIKAEKEERE
ncbi:hypothetical protein [Ammoniphilus resinae]|nr:hypothetical protein [Ammoniphilus resinae]